MIRADLWILVANGRQSYQRVLLPVGAHLMLRFFQGADAYLRHARCDVVCCCCAAFSPSMPIMQTKRVIVRTAFC